MDITVTHVPNEYEMAHGKVIASLFNEDYATDSNYRLGIRFLTALDEDTKFANLRQLPNPVGYAHFDISNILKSRVSSRPDLETITKLSTSDSEIFRYFMLQEYAYFGQEPVLLTSFYERYIINGRKPNTEIDWDVTPYLPLISEQTGGPVGTYNQIDGFQKALTDRHINSVLGSEITDGKPSWAGDDSVVNKIDLIRGDDYTLSFFSDWIANPTAGDWTNGLNAFRVAVYNGDDLLEQITIQNITGNGGGPNESIDDELQPFEGTKIISIQSGAANDLVDLHNADATHYYIASATLAFDPSAATGFSVQSEIYRFDLTDGECNDFDNIEVSWTNSLGFRDYFDFQKRSDIQIDVTRQTYQQLDANWASTEIVVNPYNRGKRVFSQKATQRWTANTRYLTDAEATYLKNLYLSPDVRVKINGTWIPVVLTSNTWTEKTFRKDKLFQNTIEFEISNPNELQQG